MTGIFEILNNEISLERSDSRPFKSDLYKDLEPKVNIREIPLKLDPSIEICKIQDSEKLSYFIIRNKFYNFLKLGPKEKLIIDLLIEGSTIEDISYEFFMEYSQLADAYIEHFVNILYKNNFLTKPYINIFDYVKIGLRKRKKVSFFGASMLFLKKKLLKNMIYIKSLHQYIDSFYKKGGHYLCSSKINIFFNISILFSFFAFSTSINFKNIDIFRVNGSLTLGMLVLFLIRAIHTSLHELGHALTVVHFKRKIIKGGVISFFGIPAFFVDTNDIWMRPKRERIMVSFAGPYVNLILNSLAIFLALLIDNPILEGFLLRFVAIGALSVFINFNPLLAFDGYFMLIDYIGYPMLRDKALNFVKGFFSKEGQKHIKKMPTKEVVLLSTYGISSILWLVIFLAFVLNVMGLRAKEIMNELINSQSYLIRGFSFVLIAFFFAPIIISILALIFFKIRDVFLKMKKKYWDPSFNNKVYCLSILNILFLSGLYFLKGQYSFYLSGLSVLASLLTFRPRFLKETSFFFIFKIFYAALIFIFLYILKLMPFIPLMILFIFLLSIFIFKQNKIPSSFSNFFMFYFIFLICVINVKDLTQFQYFGPLLFSFSSFYYLCAHFLRNMDLKSNVMEETQLHASDIEKIKIVFENHLRIFFKMIVDHYGVFHARRFIKILNKKSSDITFKFDPLEIKYSPKLEGIHGLASSLKETFSSLEKVVQYYFGKFYSQKLFLKVLDEEKWVLREVFEEYVMARGKKEIFDFSSFVEDHLQFLSKLDLFSTFKMKDLQLILSNLKSYNFQDQEYLTKEGEEGDQMFILLKGNVNVFKYNEEKSKNEKVAILGPGDVFGERTLLLGEPRSATIITEGEGSILTMAQGEFKKLLKKSSSFKDKIQKMVDESFKFYDLLKSVPLFKEITDEKLKLLAPKIKYKEFEEGDYIFKQGDKGDSFYILKEGKVEILTESEDGQTKNILATLGAGEFFGEIALFKDITRTASVKTTRKTIALSIEKADFSKVFSEKRTLERVSSRRLKEMDFSVAKKEN